MMMARFDGFWMATAAAGQPVVILGGFLITEEAYAVMADWIREHQGSEAHVIPVSRFDWMLTTWAFGWRRVLDRVHAQVQQLASASPTGRVTLIGHSSGGVMLRLYLSADAFSGRCYGGAQFCNRLITLGSPHQAQRATPLRAMVDRCYPGAFSPDVDYVAVAGKLDLKSSNASAFSQRSAVGNYKRIAGEGSVDGDGLVPVDSALLKGAQHLVLDDTSHGGLFGIHWYGSPARVALWADQISR